MYIPNLSLEGREIYIADIDEPRPVIARFSDALTDKAVKDIFAVLQFGIDVLHASSQHSDDDVYNKSRDMRLMIDFIGEIEKAYIKLERSQ